MRSFVKLMAVIAMLSLVLVPALNAMAEGQKIGHANMARVYYSYDKVKSSAQELKDYDAKKEAERAKKVEAIEKIRQEVELLTGEARTAKSIEGENKVAELNEFDRTIDTERKKMMTTARQQNVTAMMKAIEEAAKNGGYDYIINSGFPDAVLYASEANDLTDQLIQQLNVKK